MAYNPYSAVNAIYKLKEQWNTANEANDETKKNEAAQKAQAYYNQLKNNGYSDIADSLTASDYTQAKAINDKWAKTGKTPTRDYLYTLGQSYGLSQGEMDKLISWDNDTGEVSFGGKKIGKPDTEVDGTSYWSDTTALDNAFNDYIERSGTTRSKAAAVNQENENLFKKYNQEYEDLKSTNPFETDEAKSILAKYDLAGLQGRDNAVASNAGSNGGNIDSFAAANALRQQSSLINQGQTAVLEAYQQKLDHARSLLSDMGVNIDRVYNQDETSKNNDVARKSEIASVSGYTPDEWVASNNPYLNDDGTLKEEYKDIDFSEVMAKAKAAGNENAYNAAAQARYYKIMGNYGLYGQYDDGNYAVPRLQQTEVARQFDEQIAASDRALNAETSMNAANNQNKIDQITTSAKYGTTANSSGTVTATKPTLTAAQATNAIKNGEISQSVIDAYNYYYRTNYTVENPPKVNSNGTSGTNLLTGGTTEKSTSSGKYSYWDMKEFPFATVKVGAADESRLKSCGVDEHGRKAIEGVISAVAEGKLGVAGEVSNYDLADYLVRNSDSFDTNKNQLGKVFSYFGLDKKMLDETSDSGFWPWEWNKGVKYD